ncbi:MAG: type I-E CRISPR-associated protein Cse1/CasA [Nitrospirota bacterium]
MNLIKDKWLPVVRASGNEDLIAPWQIAEKSDPVLELKAPRPDFQGALYQFLIGLLQTCFAPDDQDEWIEYWEEMPDADKLNTSFMNIASAFELDITNGPAFMQDFNLETVEEKAIAALLIESPGGKTLKDNLDHFIKRDTINNLCYSCAATALFTLQINAPSGGVGHRVSLRGGGPITTLVRPAQASTLWQKLWLNVLDAEAFTESVSSSSSDVFPWVAQTRTSERKGSETRPADVHKLQIFWSMPRRVRLRFDTEIKGDCDMCRAKNKQLVTKYSTQNYGVNYEGEWIHTLTPYRFDSKKEKPPISLKGQRGGLGYQHWLGLVMNDPAKGNLAAKVVRNYLEDRARDISESYLPVLWAFGYDMDNMKARCWYDHTLPLFKLDKDQQNNMTGWVSELIESARDTAEALRSQVKAAWFRRPKDSKGDMSVVSSSFWRQSENMFYKLLERLSQLPETQRQVPTELYDQWVKSVRSLAYRLFDEWALESPADDLDMKRVTAARRELKKQINTSKTMKSLTNKAKP